MFALFLFFCVTALGDFFGTNTFFSCSLASCLKGHISPVFVALEQMAELMSVSVVLLNCDIVALVVSLMKTMVAC